MRNKLESSRAGRACFAAALIALCAFAIRGQSGRRVRKPEPQPVPTAQANSTPAVSAKNSQPLLTFLVATSNLSDGSRIPAGARTAVLRACANRLDESETVKADFTSKDMNRGDAILRAKSEKEVEVVWLRLRRNDVSGRAGSNDPDDLYIEYSVFAPTTGKEVSSGRVFSSYRVRAVIPGPQTTSVYNGAYLVQAARETAERILATFHVKPSGG